MTAGACQVVESESERENDCLRQRLHTHTHTVALMREKGAAAAATATLSLNTPQAAAFNTLRLQTQQTHKLSLSLPHTYNPSVAVRAHGIRFYYLFMQVSLSRSLHHNRQAVPAMTDGDSSCQLLLCSKERERKNEVRARQEMRKSG